MSKSPLRRRRKIAVTLELVALAIDSNYEPVTAAACKFRNRQVYPVLSARGFVLEKLQGPLARRFYIAPAAARPAVDYITGVGHGVYDTFTGHQGDVVLRVGEYQAAEVSGKIVHLLSCQTARELGPDLVRHGCAAFFGYDENFTFHFEFAETFFACDAEIDLGFAAGLTAKKVYARVRATFERAIAELLAAGHVYVAATLRFDLDHLRSPEDGRAWGNGRAKLK
jgi:hypothetical protein